MADNAGYIYVLDNPSIPNLLKIGRTSKNPFQRASELHSTGVPTPFRVLLALYTRDTVTAEKVIHQELAEYRSNAAREFFGVDLATALAACLCHPELWELDSESSGWATQNSSPAVSQAEAQASASDMTLPAPDLPAVGSVWVPMTTWDCFHHVSGQGFTTNPADRDPKQDKRLLGYGVRCRVVMAGPEELLILTEDEQRLVRITPDIFAYLMRPSV